MRYTFPASMARRKKSRSVLLGIGKAVVLLGAFGVAYALFALGRACSLRCRAGKWRFRT